MRWLPTEYILKGVYLGLLLFAALQGAAAPQSGWLAMAGIPLFAVAGLALGLGIAAVQKVRQGYRVQGRFLPFLLFLLLESPTLVYAGVLGGTLLGAWIMPRPAEEQWLLPAVVGGGAVLGVLFGLLRHVQHGGARIALSLALAAIPVAGMLLWFGQVGGFGLDRDLTNPTVFGVQLLLGIPLFYLLTFAGREEESEVEIGVMCALFGLGMYALTHNYFQFKGFGFILAVMLYFYYTSRVLPALRVFKHALRGLSYARVGRTRLALMAFRRALQLDPQNKLARDGLWSMHRDLDLNKVGDDPDTLGLIDLDLCLDRAGALLLEPRPGPEKLDEAHRLLDLVLRLNPALRPRVAYWRTVAHTHARRLDEAAAELTQLLDPARHGGDPRQRQAVLLPAWQLALTLHEELRRRVGVPQLALPGRRMEAIRAVERQLAAQPDDPGAWALKRLLYHEVTEADYNEAAGGPDQAVSEFDYAYAQQLGLALIDDPQRWQRGGEYLRLAARGMPALGPSLFIQIAQAHQRASNTEGMWHNYELAKRAGRAVGPKNLPDEDRHAWFATVKLLAEHAQAEGDLDAAIENYHLYTEYERSGLETLRTLADLYEKKGDALAALRVNDQALVYSAADKDLLARKDRYYYSVTPDELRRRREWAGPGFDVAYCLKKAKSLLDLRDADLELLDWAQHLIELALVIHPDSLGGRVLLARALLRRGEKDQAVAILEKVRDPRPEKFASSEEEEAWFLACRLLGELYLYDLGRPDLAVPCFSDYRKSAKSGADTLYKLGQAYEQLGDLARARKCYEHVTAYDGHPLAPDAREALYRLQAS